MTRRAKILWAGAALFTFINVAGAVYAFGLGEMLHGGLHAVLLVPVAYFAARHSARARRETAPEVGRTGERLDYLQQSVDAVALEVERIGEAQRFRDKLQAERAETRG